MLEYEVEIYIPHSRTYLRSNSVDLFN